jgi:hypothetical protein
MTPTGFVMLNEVKDLQQIDPLLTGGRKPLTVQFSSW